jgi:hypothetical protein
VKLIAFLSTGRCGTQFFTRYLADAGGGRAVVEHEPIKAKYAPKHTLRAPDLEQVLPRFAPVERHLDEIAQIVETGKVYVETGWPNFSWIPLLVDRFGEQALVVHLTRHPVQYAYSLASLMFYSPHRKDAYVRLARLHPADPGVKHGEYAAQWKSLNPVERSLFQWLEVNTWAEELKSARPASFITLRSEDLLASPQVLVESMIERAPSLADVFPGRPSATDTVDALGWSPTRHARKRQLTIDFEPESLRCSPAVPRLAERYGYSMNRGGSEADHRFLQTSTEA